MIVKYDYEIYEEPQEDKDKTYDKDEYLKDLYKILGYGGMHVQNNR